MVKRLVPGLTLKSQFISFCYLAYLPLYLPYLVLPSFYRVFTEFYRVALLALLAYLLTFLLASLKFTEFYRVLPSFSFYLVFSSFSWLLVSFSLFFFTEFFFGQTNRSSSRFFSLPFFFRKIGNPAPHKTIVSNRFSVLGLSKTSVYLVLPSFTTFFFGGGVNDPESITNEYRNADGNRERRLWDVFN